MLFVSIMKRNLLPAILFLGFVPAVPVLAQYDVPTTTQAYASASTVTAGASITVSANTTAQGEGTFSLYDNGRQVCSYYTSYTISCTDPNLSAGTHKITASWSGSYNGDVYYEPSSSSPVTVVVNAPDGMQSLLHAPPGVGGEVQSPNISGGNTPESHSFAKAVGFSIQVPNDFRIFSNYVPSFIV